MSNKFNIYVFLGKVEKEEDKLYYWKSFEKLYDIVNPIMQDFEFKKVMSDQNFKKLLKVTKDGLFKVTFKNAPTGGKLNWNRENCKKLSTKHLWDNEHLIYTFKHGGLEANKKFLEAKGQLTEINSHEIYGSFQKKPEILDFILRIYPQYSWQKHYNQYINLFIRTDYVNNNLERVNKMIEETYKLSKSIKLVQSSRDWEYSKIENGIKRVDPLSWKRYLAVDSLDVKPNKYDNWKEIKL